MPLVAVSLVVLLGSIGICTDLMRDMQAAHELQYAAQAAALYGLSQATLSNGAYTQSTAQTNIANAVISAGTAAWNKAQSGPVANVWSTPVTFANQTSIQFVPNPNAQDATDFFVQVTGQRTRADGNALTNFFLPVFNASFQSNSPGALTSFDTVKTVEAVLQPASRIGAGAPPGTQGAGANFSLCAALPIAISNRQFAAIASTGTTGSNTFLVDFVSSQSPSPAPGHLVGCFINDGPSGNTGSYYGGSSSAADVSQLQSLLSYFGVITSQAPQAPAAIERGGKVGAFDPSGAAFGNIRTQLVSNLKTWITTHSNNYYIVPVIAGNPTFAATGNPNNNVVGFSRLRLLSVPSGTAGALTVQVMFGESVAMRNAACAEGYSVVTFNNQQLMPPPVAPFTPRSVIDANTQSLAARPLGVVMAPAVSPRNLRVVFNLPTVQH